MYFWKKVPIRVAKPYDMWLYVLFCESEGDSRWPASNWWASANPDEVRNMLIQAELRLQINETIRKVSIWVGALMAVSMVLAFFAQVLFVRQAPSSLFFVFVSSGVLFVFSFVGLVWTAEINLNIKLVSLLDRLRMVGEVVNYVPSYHLLRVISSEVRSAVEEKLVEDVRFVINLERRVRDLCAKGADIREIVYAGQRYIDARKEFGVMHQGFADQCLAEKNWDRYWKLAQYEKLSDSGG